MPGKTQITVVGNAGSDPELRFTPSGSAVCSFSVAVTPRWFDRQTEKWQDGDITWYRISAWRSLAENVAETIQKGSRVIVLGTLENREWEDSDGNTRTTLEIQADAVGPDLTFASARITKSERSSAPEPVSEPEPTRARSGAAKPARTPARSRR